MAIDFKRDSAGIEALLKSPAFAAAVKSKANDIARNVTAQGHTVETPAGAPLPVEVSTYTTDRAAAAVTIAHPAGRGMQAKHGVLTKAAAAAGLEVRAR